MKTLGRILVILIMFVVMMGVTYSVVSASGSSSTGAPAIQRGGGDFQASGVRPENRDGRGFSPAGMLAGLLKNSVIVAFFVVMIAFPKSLIQQRRRTIPARIQ